MPLKLEILVPEGSTNIYGEVPSEEKTQALASRVPYLPVCDYVDQRKITLYSHNPFLYEQENFGLYPNIGDAYAWRRLPRFIDRFKEVRETMRATCPNELVLSLDVGSSVPIYSEMMRAHWLRKCGDHAQQAFTYALSVLEDRGRVTNILVEQHSRKGATFKTSFISCLQTALYCIPYELSGDESAIREYLVDCLSLLLSSTDRFINRKDRKDPQNLREIYEKLEMVFDPARIQRVPLERAWRIDSPLGPAQGSTCLQDILDTKIQDPLTLAQEHHVKDLATRISRAGREKDHDLVLRLRKEVQGVIGSRSARTVDQEQASLFLAYLIEPAVDFVLRSGYAPPVRFMSLDQRDPLELASEAKSSLDAETKMSGFYRRTIERLIAGDPDHIHDSISRVRSHVPTETATAITSIESFPFYADQPERLRDVDEIAEDIAKNMLNLCATLRKQGEYMTFPWGTSAFSNLDDGISARLARERLPEEILKKISAANVDGEFLISREVYSPEEVRRWMSQGEFDTLLNLSPAVDTGSDSLIEVLRIRRAKKGSPSGKLLGAKQIR